MGSIERPDALSIVVGILIFLIGICAASAIALAILHFNGSPADRTQALSGSLARLEKNIAHSNAPAAGLRNKRPGGSGAAVCDSDGKGVKLHHRPNSGCSLAASSGAPFEFSSMYDTQETMDSIMVQEILGSVDANHIRETQVLLHSFNWDLSELMHEEVAAHGKAA